MTLRRFANRALVLRLHHLLARIALLIDPASTALASAWMTVAFVGIRVIGKRVLKDLTDLILHLRSSCKVLATTFLFAKIAENIVFVDLHALRRFL